MKLKAAFLIGLGILLFACEKLSPPEWIQGKWTSLDSSQILWTFAKDSIYRQIAPYDSYPLQSDLFKNWHQKLEDDKYILFIDHSFERVSMYHVFEKIGEDQLRYYQTYWPDSLGLNGKILQKTAY